MSEAESTVTDSSQAGQIKRLALCITDLEVGGAERCLVELATRIDRKRFLPVVYCLAPRPEPGPKSLVERLQAADVPVTFLDAKNWTASWRVLRRLTRLWREERPDIVQTFLFHANILGRIAARRAGIPLVFSGIRVAERRGRWRLRLERWTSRMVDRHVCVSQAVADFSRRNGGLPADRLVVIPNGVDVERFHRATPTPLAELGVLPGRRVITFVGRLDRQKGLDRLLRACAAWIDLLPEHDLLLVGTGPERPALEQLVAQLRIGRHTHFAGWQSDIPGILAASDLLVLPSAWEGMPNVVLEAMAAGKPVVASDVEGVGELLGETARPQIVSAGNTQGLVDKVVAIISSRQLASELGEKNAARAAEKFSVQTMVKRYEQLYQRVTGS